MRGVAWAGLAASLALWVSGLAAAHPAQVTTSALGLVTVLGAGFWAGLGLLIVSFAVTLAHPGSRWPVLAGHLVALAMMLHATPAIVYRTLRYSWSWKHVGVTDYIAHQGINFRLGGVLGVYQGWPGFFSLNAFLTRAGGLTSALGYAPWALVAADLLWLGPVVLIARAFTPDRRMAAAAALLFELGNWVGQDYFSPQALTYFLYLTVIAVCLRWLPGRRDGGPAGPASSRYALLACLLPVMAAVASSHQLTPFMLIAALALLAVTGHLRPWLLPVAMAGATTAGWLACGALPWLSANRYQLLSGLGVPWANTSAHLASTGAVPAGQLLVDWGARLLSAGIGVLAAVGFWRYRRRAGPTVRRSWHRIALLTVAAFPAAAANSYGGEIIFRVYLFALPFLAVAAAAAFFPAPPAAPPACEGLPAAPPPACDGPAAPAATLPAAPPRRAALASAALAVTALALAAGFSLGNYGKEAMNYFPPQEVAAAQWLYRTAPRGARVVAANSNFPWAFVHYTWYSYVFLDTPPTLGTAALRHPVSTVAGLMEPGRSPASYLILTASQAAEISVTGEWPPGACARLFHTLITSGTFRVVYRAPGAAILRLAQ